MSDIAWQLFGNGPTGWARVQAICDFVHTHIAFGYEYARRTRTAWEAHNERQGVCRDFAHVGIALCRSLQIPARMVVGYMHGLKPMDLHAWFEAFLGGRWYTFDATQDAPRGARIVLAYGHDATDVAFISDYGPRPLQLNEMRVEVTAA